MTRVNLTREQAERELYEIAQANPEYEYVKPAGSGSACVYFEPVTDAPSCIVGHLLARHGVTGQQARDEGWNNSGIDALFERSIITSSDENTKQILLTAQIQQDRRVPWLRAVKAAITARRGR